MDLHHYITVLFLVISIWGTYSYEIQGWQPNYLDGFRFIPILGDCYQLYHPNELTSSCRREPNFVNQACIQWISDNHECLGLVTPTNETVILRCTFHIRFDKCFEVYNANRNITIVCQEIIEDHGVGIITPDNFTILLHNPFCRPATSVVERQVYSHFVNSFSLDVEARSCYKVYSPEEVITPYNCLSKSIHSSCAFSMEEGCTALTTQNNEVLLLDCSDQSQRQHNCYSLYTPDNQVHTVCQKIVEERCVGVVTPSNLTVLFECFFCSVSPSSKHIYYNRKKQRIRRQFVKSYFENGYLSRNLPLLNFRYQVFNDNMEWLNSFVTYSYWIPKTSCVGLTLESNETIILECMIPNENYEQPGCFHLVTKEKENQTVCAKILNEACVGVTTPRNFSIALACYEADNKYTAEDNRQSWYFMLQELKHIVNNKQTFYVGQQIDVYKEKEDKSRESKIYQVKQLNDQPDCVGVQTETEIIILNCSDGKNEGNGCFDVVKIGFQSKNEEPNTNRRVEKMCVKVLDSECIGIITSDNYNLQLSCFTPTTYQASAASGAASGFISDNIRPKLPPRLRRNLQ